MTRLRKFLKTSWAYSFLLTLPVTVVFAVWLFKTAEHYVLFGVHYNAHPENIRLYDTGLVQFDTIVNNLRPANGSTSRQKAHLRTFNLFLPEASYAELTKNLPHSGGEYVDAGLWDDGRNAISRVKVKLRGDHARHWAHDKKSLRIKPRKSQIFEGMRAFNLIVSKLDGQLNNYLGYRLAKLMGLMTPKTEMVSLAINGKPYGVYSLVEQLEEITLRRQKKMPGDLYVGELYLKDHYTGASNKVFEHAGLWDKVAVNNHYPADSRKPLERLVALSTFEQTEDTATELSNLLDMTAWGKFAAFQTLAQTPHFDDIHNWRLFFDPATSKFIPIVWDPTGWPGALPFYASAGDELPLDFVSSRLHVALFQNGDFIKARQKELETFFINGLDQRFLAEVREAVEAVGGAFESDPFIFMENRRQINPALGFGRSTAQNLNTRAMELQEAFYPRRKASAREARQAMEELKASIEETFSAVRGRVFERPGEVFYRSDLPFGKIALSFSERRVPKRLSFHFRDPVNLSNTVKLRYQVQGAWFEVGLENTSFVNGRNVEIATELLPNLVTNIIEKPRSTTVELKVFPAYYELVLPGVLPENKLLEVSAYFVADQVVSAQPLDRIQPAPFRTLKRVVNAETSSVPLVWNGEVFVDGVKEIQSDLIVRPGSTVLFEPGATLILKGRLLAEGTKVKPIQFLAKENASAPWGAVVLLGNGANGSRLEHCYFTGGSGLKTDLSEYSAMLSIHDVKGVRIEACQFSDSAETDDMVHAVYAEVAFKGCVFERSKSDALDIDISTATVEDCFFTDSGNDALDLMDSEVVVADSIMERSGDKGISVGEGSRLFAVNSLFKGNAIGVQVKDGSTASLYNVDFSANKLALDAYKKNWRYNGGGDVFVHKSRFMDNQAGVTADKDSTISISDSFFSTLPELKKKRIRLDETVDTNDGRRASTGRLHSLPKESPPVKGFGPEYWQRVDPTRRGALNLGQH